MLIAIANSVRDVGYVQGLNSIAGVLLFYLKEEESYWTMLYMLNKLNIRELLKENFSNMKLLNYQFQTYLENYVPEIAEHFVR